MSLLSMSMFYVCEISDGVSTLRGRLSHASSDTRNTTALKYVIMRICWSYPSANTRRTAFSAVASRLDMDDIDCRMPVICCGDTTKVRLWRTCSLRIAVQTASPMVPPSTRICVMAPMATAWLIVSLLLFSSSTQTLTHVSLFHHQRNHDQQRGQPKSKSKSHDNLVTILCMCNTVLRGWQGAR